MRTIIIALFAAATLAAGCGLGIYNDTGGANPGQEWPWVCPDGGVPDPDAGCLPPPVTCTSADTCADGGR